MKTFLIGLLALVSLSAFAKDQACLRMVVEPENLSIVSSLLKSNKIEFKVQSNHAESSLLFQKGATLTIFTNSSSELNEKLKKNDVIESMQAEDFPCGMYRATADILKL